MGQNKHSINSGESNNISLGLVDFECNQRNCMGFNNDDQNKLQYKNILEFRSIYPFFVDQLSIILINFQNKISTTKTKEYMS